jgi:hypothetical protein
MALPTYAVLPDTTLTQKGEMVKAFEKRTFHDKFHSKQVPTYKKREWRTRFLLFYHPSKHTVYAPHI